MSLKLYGAAFFIISSLGLSPFDSSSRERALGQVTPGVEWPYRDAVRFWHLADIAIAQLDVCF